MENIISSGETGGIILENDIMTIADGGIVNGATVNEDGGMEISSGGAASGTTINADGWVYVYESGTADSTTINESGRLDVDFGGAANSTTINNGGVFYLYTDGTASNTTVNAGGSFHVAGGTAGSTTVNDGGIIYLFDGEADNTTVNAGGSLHIEYGVADNTTVNAGGSLHIEYGAAYNTTVNDGGTLEVSNECTAIDITENGGYVEFAPDADVSFVPNSFSGLSLSDTSATVHSGTTATDTALNAGGNLNVFSGGTANGTTVNEGGRFDVDFGGAANDIAVNEGGAFYVHDDGTASNTTVNEGGAFYVYYGGTANDIRENGGYVEVATDEDVSFVPNSFSGLSLSDTSATVHSGTTATDTTVDAGGNLTVYSGGSAESTAVNSGGMLRVEEGGSANDIRENGGYVYCHPEAEVTFALNSFSDLVLSDSFATVHSGTTATDATVNAGGSLTVFSGGSADSTAVNSGGMLRVEEGGSANDTTVNSGGTLFVSSGGTAAAITVKPGGKLIANFTGTTATGIVEEGGYVHAADTEDITYTPNTIDDLLLENASATVHSGTTATNITVEEEGLFVIFSGGSADHTTVNAGGQIIVSGGSVDNATVNFGGHLSIMEGASAVNVLENGGYVSVDYFDVSFLPNILNDLLLESGASATIHSGTTANNITVNSRGRLEVFEGGSAVNILENGGYVDIEEDVEVNVSFMPNTISDLLLEERASATIHSGTTANNITVNSRGRLEIFEGGSAVNILENGGFVSIEHLTADVTFASNTFNDLLLERGASATIHSGTTANKTVISSGGRAHVYSGGTANSTTVTSQGIVWVSSGGTAENTIVNSYGSIGVFLGGTAENTTVNNYGRAYIHRGGTANGTVINSGGTLYVEDSGTANNTVINAKATLANSRFATLNGTVINSGGTLMLEAAANNTVVNSGGLLLIANGGMASGTIVNSGGTVTAKKDAIMDDTSINFGGLASAFTLGSGLLTVSMGGQARSIIVSSGGTLTAKKDAKVKSATVSSGGLASGVMLYGGNRLTIASGGTANGTIINSGGSIILSSGGTANGTIVCTYFQQNVQVEIRGTANDTLLSGGTLLIRSGATANNTVVSCFALPDGGDLIANGRLVVSGGGIANSTFVCGIWNNFEGFRYLSGGIVDVFANGEANFTSVGSGGRLIVHTNGTANDTVVGGYPMLYGINDDDIYSGTVEVQGGTVNRITLNYGGRLEVYGGSAFDIVENGGCVKVKAGENVTFASNTFSGLILSAPVMTGSGGVSATVHSGTTAVDVTVMNSGFLTVYSGGRLTGRLNNLGGSVSAFEGAIVDFDLARTAPGAAALVNDLSLISGTPSYTITAGADQAEGLYTLAGGAAEFSGTITVNAAGADPGTIAVGETITVSGVEYTLLLSDGTLSLKVGETDTPSPYASDGLTLFGAAATVMQNRVYHETLVCSGGSLAVDVGGTADGVILAPGGVLTVRRDGAAVNVVESGGFVEVKGGAEIAFVPNTFSNALIMEDEKVTLHSGTTACNTKLAGELFIYDGGVADVVDPLHLYRQPHNSFGVTVFSGGTANSVTLIDGICTMHVSDGGVANDTLITSFNYADGNGGRLFVERGGTANGTVLERGAGSMTVSAGGTAVNTTIKEGIIDVYGTADGIIADVEFASKAGIIVHDGATATGITGVGGYVSVEKNATVSFDDYLMSGVILSNTLSSIRSATVYSGMMAYLTSVDRNGTLLDVSGGGIADSTSVVSGGSMVLHGGTANNTYLFMEGILTVTDGATANSTSINRGFAHIRGGTANFTTVFAGEIHVSDGGTANSTTMSGGWLHLSGGGLANSTVLSGGDLLVSGGGMANSTVLSGGRFHVLSGGSASGTLVVSTFGEFRVSSGGTAVGTTISKGKGIVYRGGTAVDTIVSGGSFFVQEYGTASNTTIISGGSLLVSYGGTAIGNTVTDGGRLTVSSGTAGSNTVLSRGTFQVSGGGMANDTTVSSGGSLQVLSGTANNTIVRARGSLTIGQEGMITGKMTFEENAIVSAKTGATVDFDLTQTSAGAAALVNDLSAIQGLLRYTLTVDDSQKDLPPGSYVYALADGAAGFSGAITVRSTCGNRYDMLEVGKTVKVGYNDYTLNLTGSTLSVTVDAPDLTPQDPVGTPEQVSWETTGAGQYVVEYSTDNFEHVIRVVTSASATEMPGLPAGTYQWRVKADANSEWAVGEEIVSEAPSDDAPKVVQAVGDGSDDIFFASTNGTWNRFYYAQHVGSINDWDGTQETVSAGGKGRIRDLFFGSDDPNVLCLTDGENGDAIFVDDAFSGLPEEIEENTARLYRIQEIRAGAGDDIVDMTSQRCEYTGDGLTIRGGDGDDVIWANKGDNLLFGDAGNDRIVGASGNDVIVGGIGDDSMHGGGGNDVFVFCDNWGTDTVEQIGDGSVTLWFASGDEENWDSGTMTYTDGENSVTVSGVGLSRITLWFYDDCNDYDLFETLTGAGAFDAFTSHRVFEESGGGLLASL